MSPEDRAKQIETDSMQFKKRKKAELTNNGLIFQEALQAYWINDLYANPPIP